MSDEIYEKILYTGSEFVSPASFSEDIKKLTITINGFSKAHSMTGWRLGYAAADLDIVAAMSKIQDQSTSNPTSIRAGGGGGSLERAAGGRGDHASGIRRAARLDRAGPE